jgi:hypothetical protein
MAEMIIRYLHCAERLFARRGSPEPTAAFTLLPFVDVIRSPHPPGVRFAFDSPLEGSGFELLVPLVDAGLDGARPSHAASATGSPRHRNWKSNPSPSSGLPTLIAPTVVPRSVSNKVTRLSQPAAEIAA